MRVALHGDFYGAGGELFEVGIVIIKAFGHGTDIVAETGVAIGDTPKRGLPIHTIVLAILCSFR